MSDHVPSSRFFNKKNRYVKRLTPKKLHKTQTLDIPPTPEKRKARGGRIPTQKVKRPRGDVARIIMGRAEVLNLYKSGMSYTDIATKLGQNKSMIAKWIQAELLELRDQTELDAQAIRDVELQRLDRMMQGLWPSATKGKVASVLGVCKLMERRAKLLGLDAPTKTELTGALIAVTPSEAAKMTDEDLKRRTGELLARMNGEPRQIEGTIIGEVVGRDA